jgi:hypothetical protein
MKLFQENHINNLPDCYNKDKTSNNYKILEVSKKNVNAFRECLISIDNSLNLDNAKGATLDLYGDLVGQKRGLATDEQFVLLIKTRIMRNLANGSYKSITDALRAILNCDNSQILIEEVDAPCKIKISKLPLKTIQEADLSTTQVTDIIKTLMPVGIIFDNIVYDGTFAFSAVENEYDETAGFCDVEGGTLGGYLGALSASTNETILPI